MPNPEENQMVFENTHEPIIDLDTWERIQELRKNKRRPTRTGKTNMFSGLAYCADCGQKLYYCTSKNFESRQDHEDKFREIMGAKHKAEVKKDLAAKRRAITKAEKCIDELHRLFKSIYGGQNRRSVEREPFQNACGRL